MSPGEWYEEQARLASELREKLKKAEVDYEIAWRADPSRDMSAHLRKIRHLKSELEMALNTGD